MLGDSAAWGERAAVEPGIVAVVTAVAQDSTVPKVRRALLVKRPERKENAWYVRMARDWKGLIAPAGDWRARCQGLARRKRVCSLTVLALVIVSQESRGQMSSL